MQTLEQLCIGLSNKEIARNLDIQEVTVKLHVKNIFSKLGVSNRTQAALFAKERIFFNLNIVNSILRRKTTI